MKVDSEMPAPPGTKVTIIIWATNDNQASIARSAASTFAQLAEWWIRGVSEILAVTREDLASGERQVLMRQDTTTWAYRIVQDIPNALDRPDNRQPSPP